MISHSGMHNNKPDRIHDENAWLRQRVAELEHDKKVLEQQVCRYVAELEASDQHLKHMNSGRRQTPGHSLEQHNNLLRLLLDAINDGMWDWNLATGNVYYSPRWQTMLGYEPDELGSSVGTWESLLHEDDKAQTLQVVHNHMQGHTPAFEIEFRMRTKAGEWKWILGRGRVVERDAQGQPLRMIGTHTDITKRKEQEEVFRLAQFTLDQAADGIHWINQEGLQVHVNNALCKALGYTREEMLGMRVPDIDPNFPTDAWEFAWEDVKQKGASTFETTQRRKDGSMVPVEVTASYLNFNGKEYICSFVRDISERKQTERAFHEQKEQYRSLVESIDDWIWEVNADGFYTYSSPAVTDLLGYAPEELIGKTPFDFMLPDEARRIGAIFQEIVSRQQPLHRLENRLCHKDGSEVIVETNGVPFFAPDGSMRGYRGIDHNVTTRRQIEAERAVLQEQIIATQRATLEELSTPLIPISDRVVLLPLIGTIDTRRAQQVMEALLEGVTTHRARIAILDITGVKVVDSQVADALLRSAQAVKLLGAQVVLTGIQPAIAQTLVHLGADLSSIVTRGSLQAGISYALGR